MKKMRNLVPKSVAEQSFDKKIMGTTHGLKQLFQQRAETVMRLHHNASVN